MKTLQPLKQPQPIGVEADESGEPVAVVLGSRRLAVAQVQDVWRIDDEWWRDEVSRLYYRLILANGRTVTIYQDLVHSQWLNQNYD
jgi:hypothetical protein